MVSQGICNRWTISCGRADALWMSISPGMPLLVLRFYLQHLHWYFRGKSSGGGCGSARGRGWEVGPCAQPQKLWEALYWGDYLDSPIPCQVLWLACRGPDVVGPSVCTRGHVQFPKSQPFPLTPNCLAQCLHLAIARRGLLKARACRSLCDAETTKDNDALVFPSSRAGQTFVYCDCNAHRQTPCRRRIDACPLPGIGLELPRKPVQHDYGGCRGSFHATQAGHGAMATGCLGLRARAIGSRRHDTSRQGNPAIEP